MSSPFRVVMLVDNRVVGDSRVIKSARSAAAAGYDVVILGMGPREELTIGGIPTILCPPLVTTGAGQTTLAQQVAKRLGHRDLAAAQKNLAKSQARTGRRVERAKGLAAKGNPLSAAGFRTVAGGLEAAAKAQRLTFGARSRLARAAAKPFTVSGVVRSRLGIAPPTSSAPKAWPDLDPIPQRLSNGWQAELERLDPDLIHAHDYRTLPAAIAARDAAAERGRDITVLYDAHEWVQGYTELGEKRHEAAMQIERTLIGRADAVITVAPAIAEMIEESYTLARRPPVVLNAPEEPPGPTPGPTLRERIRIDAQAPLLVYAGSVGAGRSLDLCVEALPLLPGVHLAYVVGQPDSARMVALAARAVELGVRDRFHLTRYVPQEFIVDFVRGADIGLTPMRHDQNTENSLPTKAREYLLADVPQVVSDVRTLSAFVREHGLGEVYIADDVESFAQAVRTVLADPAAYRGRLTEALRQEHSWEAQAEVLTAEYAALLQGTAATGPKVPALSATTDEPDRLLPISDAPVRLVIGPSNSAGQGRAWAAAARSDTVDAINVAIAHDGGFTFPSDRVITTAERTDPQWVRRFEDDVCATRTHVLLESGSTLTGSAIEPIPVATHVDRLEAAGVRVGMVLHGSEVRDPALHAAAHTWSAFRDVDPQWRATLERRVATTKPVVEWLGLPTFVSTLDLLDDVPYATWLPVTIDVDRFTSSAPLFAGPVPVVLHAPSAAALKGSAHLDPVLDRLAAEGLIDYRRVRDVAPEQMPELLRTSDIVVDQVGLGLYGALAIEAMAAGRLVLSQVGDAIRERTPAPIPILEVSAATFEERLRAVLADPSEGAELAASGPAFVGRFHDGRAAAEALAGFLSDRG